jgi:hypothetical protein
MQSKWLTWQPGFVGSVGSPQGGNPIIQANGGTDSGISEVPTPSIIENYPWDLPSKPTKLPPQEYAYAELVGQAMQRIAEVCPAGALKWARAAHPALTDKIDVEIIARLDALWANHASPAEFQAALDELVRLHRDVGKLFAKEKWRREEPCRTVAENQ